MNKKAKLVFGAIAVLLEWSACVAMFNFSIQTVLYGILFSAVTVLAVLSVESSIDSAIPNG
ncbi:hypothetical protein [Paenibacillus guangzhouensis]|uniref:hypothetical protein n=1 Tax=Paenibacillus guangzhouensis TaxID=1473112 RepID=UPI001267012D|nr:hypothetical protein [Paenibacillus guangzhouensis]